MALFPTPNAAAAARHGCRPTSNRFRPSRVASSGYASAFSRGRLIQRENDIFGDTVNLAYRLHDQAVKGQVLTSDDTASLLAPSSAARRGACNPVPVKGKAEEVELFELLWEQNPDITDVAQTVSLAAARLSEAAPGASGPGHRAATRQRIDHARRRSTCQLVIADHKASRQHCTIERRQDKFMLRDHSTNGTFVTVEASLEVVLHGRSSAAKHGWIALGQSRTDTRGDRRVFLASSWES